MDLTIAQWRKSRRSTNNGGECVEVARIGSAVAVRDSKRPEAGALVFDANTIRALLQTIKER